MSLDITKKPSLVIGKFLPFHSGHKDLITHALSGYTGFWRPCKVLVCCKAGDPWTGQQRVKWIRDSFPKEVVESQKLQVMEVQVDYCDPHDQVSWNYWASLLTKFAPNTGMLFGGEDYCTKLAAVCGWEVRLVNRNIGQFSRVSGTSIRNSVVDNWKYLPIPVKKDLVKRIAIVGAESSGKSTLAQALAEKLKTTWVPEYGREYFEWADIHNAQPEDLEIIAREQLYREELAAIHSSGLIICDTEAWVTKAWAQRLFGWSFDLKIDTPKDRYCLYALTNRLVDWVQDGTRVCTEAQRQVMHDYLKKSLYQNSHTFLELPLRHTDALNCLAEWAQLHGLAK